MANYDVFAQIVLNECTIISVMYICMYTSSLKLQNAIGLNLVLEIYTKNCRGEFNFLSYWSILTLTSCEAQIEIYSKEINI